MARQRAQSGGSARLRLIERDDAQIHRGHCRVRLRLAQTIVV
jgi:hypothetical protein